MSDYYFGSREWERIEGGEFTSVTRNSTVTESLSTVFDLLGDSRRRYLLYYLSTLDGDVAEFPAAVNAVSRYEAVGTETHDAASREEVEIDIHHDHLPRLSKAGVLDYDERQGTIRFRGHPPLEAWIETVRNEELE